jgi:exopolyphosphatase/pppGpp-phosphohydrolase
MCLALAASSNAQTQVSLPKAPQARFYGAVDLGSSGTKAYLYSFAEEEGDPFPKVEFSQTINTKLVSSMKEGRFTEVGIADAASAVKQVVEAMRAEAKKRNITVDPYYVVGSSGVALGKNTDDLVKAVKAATGIDVDFVDVANEGYFGMTSAVPKKRRGSSVYLDIGSGNTKLGCLVGEEDIKNFKSVEIKFGSKSGRNAGAELNPTDIFAGIRQFMSEKVAPAYKMESMNTPCLGNRQRIYWSGGAAWATATFMHPEWVDDNWVIVSKDDLEKFLAKLSAGTWNQQPVYHWERLPKGLTQEMQHQIKERAEKEQASVKDIFAREDIYSGVSIMKTVLEASDPKAILQFVRTGNFIYGYALERYKLASRE